MLCCTTTSRPVSSFSYAWSFPNDADPWTDLYTVYSSTISPNCRVQQSQWHLRDQV